MKQMIKVMQLTGVIFISLLYASSVLAEQVKLGVAMGKPVLLGDTKQTTYLKISLTGFELENSQQRAPVNIAIVLDKSGSMNGEKIRRAKEAAIRVLDWLDAKDIVSVITYDSVVQVLVPATKVSDKSMIVAAINKLRANGSTALFAGVSKGAEEIRKFYDNNNVNRVILLSDGQANVGPSKVSDLADLGSSLIKEGISVTTIGLGLGYNEDLMSQLASNSDGNHTFVEKAADLGDIFSQEFGDVLSVVAQEVNIHIQCAEGIRPIRMLGRDADIHGQVITTSLNQLYSKQEKYLLLEVEIPATKANTQRPVATVKVDYANITTHTTDRLSSKVAVAFTESSEIVKNKTDKQVMTSAVQQIAIQKNEEAVQLRDKGKLKEAKALLKSNAIFLDASAAEYDAPALVEQSAQNREDAEKLTGKDWNKQRKVMRKEQYRMKNQQSY